MSRVFLTFAPAAPLALALALAAPPAALAQGVSLDEALAGAAAGQDPLPQLAEPAPEPPAGGVGQPPATPATIASAARSPETGSLPAVAKLLAGQGNRRVTDGQADAVVRRLSKLRTDLAERRGGDEAALLKECDTDGDGRISLPEARAAVARTRPDVDPRAAIADRLVSAVDTDANGRADARELAAYLGSLAMTRIVVEPAAVKLWKSCDTDRDGAVSVSEARLAADQFARLLLYVGDSKTPVEDPTAWVQVVRVIERADADCSNGLSASEVAGTTVFKEWFARLDQDKSGEVTAPELYAKAADLAKVGQGEICETCPLVKKEGATKLELLQGLITLR